MAANGPGSIASDSRKEQVFIGHFLYPTTRYSGHNKKL
jgi:hypothetical protein